MSRVRPLFHVVVFTLVVAFATVVGSASAQTAHYVGTQTTLASGLSTPTGIAVDINNNVYVVDSGNNRLLKESPSATGYTETVITDALLIIPDAVAVDGAGNLYVITGGSNSSLLKLTLSNGNYTSSRIASIKVSSGVAVTGDGTAIYVADFNDSYIYQFAYGSGSYIQQTTVTNEYGVTGVATDSTGAWYELARGSVFKHAAGFSGASFSGTQLATGLSTFAYELDVDSAGNLFIADSGNNRIVEERLSGATYTLSVVASNLGNPLGVGVNANGVVFFASAGTNTVVAQNPAPLNFGSVTVGSTSAAQTLAFVFDTAGSLNPTAPYQALLSGAGNLDYAVVAGSGTTCTASASFAAGASCTVSVTFAPGVPGTRNGAILLNGSSGAPAATAFIAGTGSGPQVAFAPVQSFPVTGLSSPQGVALDGAGALYIVDTFNNRVLKEVFGSGSSTQTVIGTGLQSPQGIAVDGAGNVYIGDFNSSRVLKETYASGTYTQTVIASGLQGFGLAVDMAGNVYVPDINKNQLFKLSNVAGTYSTSVIASGLNDPYGVAVDSAGTVYIADYRNSRVLKEIYASGTYTQTVLLSGFQPTAIAVDGTGDVYVGDYSNGRVLKEVYAGGTHTESVIATVVAVGGVVVDTAGNVYIADTLNDRILKERVEAPPTLSFLSTPVGTTSSDSPQSAVISNIGNQQLFVTAATTPAPNFALDASGCLLQGVPAGASCALKYSYTPQHAVPVATSSRVTDNTLNASSFQFIPLQGAAATKGTQTITFPQPASSGSYLSGTTVPVSATSSVGLPITFSVTGTGGITTRVNGGAVTFSGSGTGTIAITASQNGTQDYNAASVTNSFTVSIVSTPASNATLADTAIGDSSTATVSVAVSTATTLGSVQGLTQGAPGLDVGASLGGGNCSAGESVLPGQVCTVTVTFSPKYPGPRYGAIQLLDGSGNLLSTVFVQANGLGPLVTFRPRKLSAGSGLSSAGQVAVDGAGNLYIADYGNNRIVEEVYSQGSYTQSPGAIGSGLNQPNGVAVDGAGNLFIADTSNNRIVEEIYAGGVYTQSPVTIGSGLSEPLYVAVDGAGNLYIPNYGTGILLKETLSGNTYTQSVIDSGLVHPFGIAVDGAGNLYVTDEGTGSLVKETFSAGAYKQSILAKFGDPTGVAVDGVGNIYVIDATTLTVVKEVLSGGTYAPAPAPVATGLKRYPDGLAVDQAGSIYIVDAYLTSVVIESVTAPPTLTFPSTVAGAVSAPAATMLTNLGNRPLVFAVPATGVNPQTAANFALETNADTTCPVETAGGTTGQLAANTTCTLSYVFAPTQVGTLTSTSVLTDNTLNAAGSTQAITLTGTATAQTQTAQTIAFPQPAAGEAYTTATLAAAASSGLPVTYAVTSGPATVSGSTITYTGAGTVVIVASQAGNATYAAAPQVSVSVTVVIVKNVWLLNTTGSLTSFDEAGAPGSGPYGNTSQASTTGGLAFDASQMAWSVTSGTNVLSSVPSSGIIGMISTGGGISTPNAVAIDGAGQVWVANGNGSVSEFTNGGTALSPSTGYTGITTATSGGTTAYSSPKGIAIDVSGNVWVTNATANTVTEILGAAAPAAPLATAITNSTVGARP